MLYMLLGSKLLRDLADQFPFCIILISYLTAHCKRVHEQLKERGKVFLSSMLLCLSALASRLVSL